jgi:hypothetical protein
VGPAAFDVGCIIGVLLLAHITLGSKRQRSWLEGCVAQFWDAYVAQLQGSTSATASGLPPTLEDVLGYAAFTMFRLTAGMHSYPGYALLMQPGGPNINPEACRLRAVQAAHQLIRLRTLRGPHCSINDVVAF